MEKVKVKSGEEFKILVIQQKMIGDVLVSSLICENLKLNYPRAKIHYLVNRFTIPVIENNPYIDEVIVFEEAYRSSKMEFYTFLNSIRKANYDVVIDAYGKLESNLTVLFSGAKIKISWDKPVNKLICTSTVKISKQSEIGLGSAIENRLNLVKAFKHSKILSQQPKIHLTKDELDAARKRITGLQSKTEESILMISALGSHETKTYPLPYMAKVLDYIVSHSNTLLLLNYMPSQQDAIEMLYSLCEKNTQKKILLDFKMRSLREFMSISTFCKAIIGNEGGAINMGKALDVPTFSIFSPGINKEGWNGLEDQNLTHASVHLKDYEPDLFLDKSEKISTEMYAKLKPELFFDVLKGFLAQHAD
ncbi:glycosyltransferase family 9 protein [Psychroflexus sp. YR1-1]|uniref:Glycosyltransferase family 9 protein n=1 Tax=Psychroflexus aurantiacus TaxID=2709310 RepID=A0A6B3R0G7_9FLAO|nr:glycosyltransferase family 9 protein [Psychroflexus aurantiacus]NEV94019.1 glycosyltransferase family 9 protein [Psychroflexus aurantiacus]